MNEWQNLALAVSLVVVAEIANEITIAILRVRNATTRFRIRLISLFSCFFVFLVLPLRMVELIIPSGKSLISSESNSPYILGGPVILASRLSRFAWISILLVLSAVFCLLMMLIFSKVIISHVLKCTPVSDPHLLALVREISCELNVHVNGVVLCRKKCDAFVYGYPPTLAVGSELLNMLNEDELRIIIRHELYHVRGKDTLIKPVVTALCIIFMYNPMVWFLSSRLAADRECQADQGAITSSQDTLTFLALLLKVHDLTRGVPHSLAVHWIGSVNRADSLFSTEKTRKIPVLVCFLLSVSLLFGGGTHLFEERYVEIERSSFFFDFATYHSSATDFSVYFIDIPLVEWYQKKNNLQRYVGIPLQESELLELLRICKFSEGGATIRLASLPFWRRKQLFEGSDDFGFSAVCRLIIDTDADGNLYIFIEKIPTKPEDTRTYNCAISS